MKLFNLVKGFFGKPAPEPVYDEQPSDAIADAEYPPAEPAEPAVLAESYSAVPSEAELAGTEVPEAAPAPSAPAINTGTSQISLPLASLIPAFPVELQKRVLTARIGEVSISFPLDKILPQLSQGLVRVTFGEIRQAHPSSFSGGADRDYVMVTLPLQELISRLGPAILAMRSRKQVEVPDEIASPFGLRGEGLTVSKAPSTPGTSFTARPRGAQAAAPVPPAADPRARGNVASIRMPSAPTITPNVTPGTSFINRSAPAPAAPAAPAAPISGASLPPVKTPVRPPIGAAPMGGFTQPPVPPAVPQRPVHAAPSASAPSGSSFSIAFNLIEESLPDAIRLEAAQMDGVQGAMLSLPSDQVAEGLKRGKVAFTWKQLRESLVPAVAPCISAHDGFAITLPLAVIAPLFLKRQKASNNGQKRVVVDDKIPNLFFGFPQGEAEPAPAPAAPVAPAAPMAIPVVPAPKTADTNYFIFDDDKEQPIAIEESVPVVRPQRTTPGTTFASRKATPNEVVTKASMLEGVYGALVALPDGLLVASKLDPSVNGETIAALIPQMYSKLSGCTKELRLGELNNLNFTVGNVPWKIYRVNGIFFAAFGTAGEPLPTGHLTELAAQLDYKRTQ